MGDDYLEIHVDETGDRGFGSKSSAYFCLAACAFRHSNASKVVDGMRNLNAALGRPAKQPIHAVDHLKDHDRLMEAVEHLAQLPVRLFFVVLPKSMTAPDAGIRRNSDWTYNYLARLLLERMSWFARGIGVPAQPIFAAVKRMPRNSLDDYIDLLRRMSSSTAWEWLMLPVEVDHAANRVGMQWADIAGRAMWKATTPRPQPPHRIEAAYLQALAPVIWRRRSIETYGIKSVSSTWHQTQPWWGTVTSAIPQGHT